jgi:hypothetical protein
MMRRHFAVRDVSRLNVREDVTSYSDCSCYLRDYRREVQLDRGYMVFEDRAKER